MDKSIPSSQLLFKILKNNNNEKRLTSFYRSNHRKDVVMRLYVIQSNNEGGKGNTIHSSTTSKSCKQNTLANLDKMAV